VLYQTKGENSTSTKEKKRPGVNFINVFTSSIYARKSQKRKNDSQVISHFVLLGSKNVKTWSKHVGEIDPRGDNENEGKGEKEERENACVCVCVSVCERERATHSLKKRK